MRLLVCGSRDWGTNRSERERSRREIEFLGPDFHVLIPAQRGASTVQIARGSRSAGARYDKFAANVRAAHAALRVLEERRAAGGPAR